MKLFLFENAIYKPNKTPFPGFLVHTNDNKNILIDTGITQADADILNERNGSNDIEIGEKRLPINVLKSLDLTPDDIDIVINTHFHYDHCGFNRLFHKSIFYAQNSHYEYALKSKEEGLGLTERYWDDPEIKYHLIDGDREILPGIFSIKTDGHMTGIQSIVVSLENTGNVLLTSDAMRDSRMLNSDNPAQFSMYDNNSELVNRGVEKFRKIIKDMDVKLIVFNHDGAVWPSYKLLPEYYD
jgi:glyoxylase-like metal-dependent hydrolase (beta-lactamase superfamily II)